MAYCDRCGAYIPDGQEVCLACGFDPEEESRQAKRAAAAQVQRERQERFEREEAERRRAERQAYDKTWAENEQRRRREEEESRRRMQEETERRRAERQAYDKAWAENEQRRRREEEDYRRRQQEAEKRAESYVNGGQTGDGGVHVFVDADGNKNVRIGDKVHVVVNPNGTKKVQIGDMAREFVNSDAVTRMEKGVEQAGGKILPLISYLGPLCILSLILGGEDSFTKFHAKQGLRLFIWSAILEAVGSMFGVGFAVAVFQVLMAIIGIKNVLNGEEKKLPYIGG